jgi:hypothetical protein
MIQRTSDEKIINMKVNISESRAIFPDTKRCMNPELNTEVEKVKASHSPAHLAEKLKHGNSNLIAGESMSAIDERVKNKQRWKVGLINKFENNQQMWGELTNSFVNKLKEEVRYDPAKDFKKENEVVNEKLARKLEIMKQQCEAHKENMQSNPITGHRSESVSVSRRRQSQFAQDMGKSDIHSLARSGGDPSARASTPGRSLAPSTVARDPRPPTAQDRQSQAGRGHRDQWAQASAVTGRPSTGRSESALGHRRRDQWAK